MIRTSQSLAEGDDRLLVAVWSPSLQNEVDAVGNGRAAASASLWSSADVELSSTSIGVRTGVVVRHLPDPATGDDRAYLISYPSSNNGVGSNSGGTSTVTTSSLASTTKTTTDRTNPHVAVAELQSISTRYGSYLVGDDYVVGDGSLYTATPVDPLFWCLTDDNATGNTTTSGNHSAAQSQSWQPLEQIVATTFPPHVSDLVMDKAQYRHVLASMSLAMDSASSDPNECFYRFSVAKALVWLTRKQQAVEAVLLQQAVNETATSKAAAALAKEAVNGGAFSDSFQLGGQRDECDPKRSKSPVAGSLEPPPAVHFDQPLSQTGSPENAATTTPTCVSTLQPQSLSVSAQIQAKEESIQVVCQYLRPVWQSRFLEHLEVTESVLETTTERQKRRLVAQQASNNPDAGHSGAPTMTLPTVSTADWNERLTQTVSEDTSGNINTISTKRGPPSQTIGAKKLAKVNTKGMKKMSAFFGAAAKKK